MLKKLARKYTHSTLVISPVIGRNLKKEDIYASEEALGLVKAADFKPVSLGSRNKYSEPGYNLGTTGFIIFYLSKQTNMTVRPHAIIKYNREQQF
jgi:hypothetical protein